jgi:hypothetical protein
MTRPRKIEEADRATAADLVRRSDRAELERLAYAAVIDAWVGAPFEDDPEQSAITLATLAVEAVLNTVEATDLRLPRDRAYPKSTA